MNLFFLRHGIAAEKGIFPSDASRPLTDEGIREMKKIAKGVENLDLKLDLLLSSPFIRARQTAEIVAKTLQLEHALKLHESLEVGGDSVKLIRDLNRNPAQPANILLVGHEPSLSGLISFLLTGTRENFLALKKGSLCKLEISTLKFGKCAELKWLLTPRQLTRL